MALEILKDGPLKGQPIRLSSMSWSAILAGSVATLGVGLMFMLLGNALGLSVGNLIRGSSSVSQVFCWIYGFVTLSFSFLVGGYFASRMAGLDSRKSGIAHGLVSWAFSGVFIVVMGLNYSAVFTSIMNGTGPADATWLVCSVSLIGAVMSVLGGIAGRASREKISETEEYREVA